MKAAFDSVATNPSLRRDVDKAIDILREEGYTQTADFSFQANFERTVDGKTEHVFVFRGHINGAMLFADSAGSRKEMAWDFNRRMRPTPFNKLVDNVRAALGMKPVTPEPIG